MVSHQPESNVNRSGECRGRGIGRLPLPAMPARLRMALMVFASLAILAAAGVIVFTRPDAPPKLGANGFAGGLRPAIPPKDFTLRDQDGRTVSLRALRGQVVVLTFMYSTCQDTCPVTATTIRGALDDLGHDVPALAISVDPAHDTPDSAEAFLVKRSLSGGRMRFLLGTRAQLAADLARLRHPPPGQRLRALRLRAADRQARAPAHQLSGRAAGRPRPGPRHPQARGRARPRGRCPRPRCRPRRRRSRRRSRRSWIQSTKTTMSTGAR